MADDDDVGLFSSLPDELVVEILVRVSARDLCAVGSTCRRLEAISSDNTCWRRHVDGLGLGGGAGAALPDPLWNLSPSLSASVAETVGQWDLRPVARRALTFQRDLKLEYLATTAHTQDPSVDLDALNAAADASRARNNRFLQEAGVSSTQEFFAKTSGRTLGGNQSTDAVNASAGDIWSRGFSGKTWR